MPEATKMDQVTDARTLEDMRRLCSDLERELNELNKEIEEMKEYKYRYLDLCD